MKRDLNKDLNKPLTTSQQALDVIISALSLLAAVVFFIGVIL